MRCSTWPTGPGPLQDTLADATGYPLPTPRPTASQHPRQRAEVILIRAIRVPQRRVNHGHLRPPMTTASRRSRPRPGHPYRVPKLSTKYRCLRRASAPGWPKTRPEKWWVTSGAGIPSRRRQRCSGSGGRHPDRSAAGCSIWMPAPRPAPRQARRRDGIPALPAPILGQANTPRVPLACHDHRSTTVTGIAP
jgi:hypothetical protein